MLSRTLFKKASLALVFFSMSASASADDHFFHRRSHHLHQRQNIPTTLPGTWTSLGCVTDGLDTRTLSGAEQTSSTNTIESCISFCESKNFVYAGTEYGDECYCGHSIASSATNATATDCNMSCSGNAGELCGARWRLNLFWSGQTSPASPKIPASIGDWASLGCYTDNINGVRTLSVGMNVSSVTLENCTTACFNAGYRFSGAEYSGECYCGSTLASGAGPAPLSDCNMHCAGSNSEYCGGLNSLSLYNYTGSDLPTSGGGDGGSLSTDTTLVTSGLPTGWAYNTCWVDKAHGQIFSLGLGASTTNTIESCVSACAAQNYTIAGMEYADECYCGNTLANGATTAPDADCNMGCSGNTAEACGGFNRLSVYSKGPITALPVPTPLITRLPPQWQYRGCLREPSDGAKMFPYKIVWSTNNTAFACMKQCGALGFSAAGVEYGEECYCANIADVTNNNGVFGDESECNMPCPGNPATICGAANRLTTYYYWRIG